jgi:ABC-type antimicrobial peptide transport system permease subunit
MAALVEAPTPVAYLPLAQNHQTGMTLYIRTSGDPASLVASVRRSLQSLEPGLPVTSIGPVMATLSASLYPARMGAVLLMVFGGLALLLAAVGVYGVMAFSVSRRTRELGIRQALGADTRNVFQLVIGEGMSLVAIGVALGLAGAAFGTRLLTSFLYGTSTLDIATFASVPAILGAVALVACIVPARRAVKVDPMLALRFE